MLPPQQGLACKIKNVDNQCKLLRDNLRKVQNESGLTQKHLQDAAKSSH